MKIINIWNKDNNTLKIIIIKKLKIKSILLNNTSFKN